VTAKKKKKTSTRKKKAPTCSKVLSLSQLEGARSCGEDAAFQRDSDGAWFCKNHMYLSGKKLPEKGAFYELSDVRVTPVPYAEKTAKSFVDVDGRRHQMRRNCYESEEFAWKELIRRKRESLEQAKRTLDAARSNLAQTLKECPVPAWDVEGAAKHQWKEKEGPPAFMPSLPPIDYPMPPPVGINLSRATKEIVDSLNPKEREVFDRLMTKPVPFELPERFKRGGAKVVARTVAYQCPSCSKLLVADVSEGFEERCARQGACAACEKATQRKSYVSPAISSSEAPVENPPDGSHILARLKNGEDIRGSVVHGFVLVFGREPTPVTEVALWAHCKRGEGS